MGRHSEFTEEIGNRICELIATSDRGLHFIIQENDDLPSYVTVLKWLKQNPEFAINYARARELQADYMAAMVLEVARKTKIGKLTRQTSSTNGGSETTEEFDNVARSRLEVDALKWQASKLAPKKYGDKLDVTTQGEKIQPVDLSKYTYEQLQALASGNNQSGEDRAEQA